MRLQLHVEKAVKSASAALVAAAGLPTPRVVPMVPTPQGVVPTPAAAPLFPSPGRFSISPFALASSSDMDILLVGWTIAWFLLSSTPIAACCACSCAAASASRFRYLKMASLSVLGTKVAENFHQLLLLLLPQPQLLQISWRRRPLPLIVLYSAERTDIR